MDGRSDSTNYEAQAVFTPQLAKAIEESGAENTSVSSESSFEDVVPTPCHSVDEAQLPPLSRCSYASAETLVPAAKPELDEDNSVFVRLRCTHLFVTLVVMLADGLQGTHLYVLYDSYGFSVPALYSLGFFMGGILSPVSGPMIDKLGRKRSAILYCALEMFINTLEQFPSYWGLIASRVIGGFTTNLLASVFEAWLDTEYRRRGLDESKYETIMRDSVIVSNAAAIGAGFLAHMLSERFDAVGPFRGAVVCTSIALVVVALAWRENFGTTDSERISFRELIRKTSDHFRETRGMLRVGILQGLSMGGIQIFIFLWSPVLISFAKSAPPDTPGLDKHGEPAFGIIFGFFMLCGVLGGLCGRPIRRVVSRMVNPESLDSDGVGLKEEDAAAAHPVAVELLASICYALSACLLMVPVMVPENSPLAFSLTLYAFLVFEFLIGVFLPYEGVIRSLYFPTEARGSVMTLPRIIVNFAVAVCVAATMFISNRLACACVSSLFLVSASLQLSLISREDWTEFFPSLVRKKLHSPIIPTSTPGISKPKLE